jgi:GT2 family glycosyltransferase
LRRWDFANQVKTQQLDSVGIALLPGLRFIDLGQGQIDQGQFDEAKILGPSGAAALFRVAALTKIAESQSDSNQQEYFDERFFMYKEDCDLIYRLFLAGYGSIMVPQAIMYHDRTAAASGRGFWRRFSDRSHKNQQIRAWSFRNQHLLYFKHWKSQNIVNRLRIGWSMSGMFIFSLILEQFLLKEYRNFGWSKKGLTNIK